MKSTIVIVKRVLMTNIPRRRKKGRPKTRWKDACKGDMNTVEAINRATWRKKINSHIVT